AYNSYSINIDDYLGCWKDTKYGQKMTFFNFESNADDSHLVGITSTGAKVSAIIDGPNIRMSIVDNSNGKKLDYKGILQQERKVIMWEKRLETYGCWRSTNPWIRC
ncbi:unnamed protein product, partial [Didymodactylos carnosus]